MKNSCPGWRCWLIFLVLWVCHNAAVAQQDIHANTPTNNVQSQTNNFQPQSVSPTLPGAGQLGAPAVAQEDIYADALTNNFQPESNRFSSPTNKFQPPPVGPTAPGTGQLGAPYMGMSSLAGSTIAQSPYSPTGPPLIPLGPVGVYPHLRYSFLYGNGIEAEPGKNLTTAVSTVSPGVLFTMGSHWVLDYTPTETIYSNPAFRNTTGESVGFYGGVSQGDWSVRISQNYIDTTQPLIETGTQVDQVTYATAINAERQLNAKMSLQLGLNQNLSFVTGLEDLHEWTTADWLNYQIEKQVTVGLGLTGGYDELSIGSDMPFGDVLGGVSFQPAAKLSLTLMGGGEDRRFVHPSAPSLVEPVFNASARYQLLEGTTLMVAASRVVTPAFFGNEVNVITSVTGNIHQHIVGNLNFNVTGGYTTEPFTSIEAGPLPPFFLGLPPRTALVVTRTDTTTYAQFRLSMQFRTRLTGSVFYMVSDNSSSQANFSYSGNQVGFELIYRY